MTIEEYFGDWSEIIDLKEADRILKRLSASSVKICPQVKNVFRAFRLCPVSKLRVVIMGQDPYSTMTGNVPTATGLAFANNADTPDENLSPSLDILKESVIDFTVPHRTVIFEPDLEKWESQGVLLLNSALSCEMGKTGSHTLMWRPFVKSLITNLSKHTTGIVYVLMGSQAQSFEPYINKQFNYIIHIRHPSWYARTKTKMPSSLWQEINNVLIGQNGYGIKWYNEI